MVDHGTVNSFTPDLSVIFKSITDYQTTLLGVDYIGWSGFTIDLTSVFRPLDNYLLAGTTPPLSPPTVGQLWPRGDHITGA